MALVLIDHLLRDRGQMGIKRLERNKFNRLIKYLYRYLIKMDKVIGGTKI